MSSRVEVIFQFMTFVLTLLAICFSQVSLAAPPSEATYQQEKPAAAESTESSGQSLDGYNLISSELKPPPIEPPTSGYYPFRRSLSLRFLGVGTTESKHPTLTGIGVAYLWPRHQSPQAEFGADVVTEYGGHLNAGVRYVLRRQNYVRPYYLWGLTHEVVAEDGLATFVEIDSYFLRLASGIEIVANLPSSVRLDIEILAGTKKQMALIGLGWSWGW